MDIVKMFEQLRHDESHNLGLGDVRLTIAQQEEIIEENERLRAEIAHWVGWYSLNTRNGG